jgi:hypothetical protein
MKGGKDKPQKTKDEILHEKAVALTRRVEKDHRHLDALGRKVMKSVQQRRRTSVARRERFDRLSLVSSEMRGE